MYASIRWGSTLALLAFLELSGASGARAQLQPVQEQILMPSDGLTGDRFGISVAMSEDGDRVVVGAPGVASPTSDPGAAYVFVRGTGGIWTEEARFDGVANADHFGWSVAISADGSRAFVGAPDFDAPTLTSSGAVYVYFRTGTSWALEATLTPSTLRSSDSMGWSVAVSGAGDRVVTGAPNRDDGAGNEGAAFVFLRTDTAWGLPEAELLAPDRATGDGLGGSVALSRDGATVVAGATLDDVSGTMDAGSARVFTRSGTTWGHAAILAAPLPQMNGRAGISVALSRDGLWAIAGSNLNDVGATTDAGTGFVFSRSGSIWNFDTALTRSPLSGGAHVGVGSALDEDGSVALLGAWLDSAAAANAGSALVAERAGPAWGTPLRFTRTGALATERLGFQVALSADGLRGIAGFHNLGVGGAVVIRIARPNGQSCGVPGECLSGECADAVCCATACGPGAGDCRACSVAAGAATDGTCARISGPVCRPSAGSCDAPETCGGLTDNCPADVGAPDGTACDDGDMCTVPDICTGGSCGGSARACMDGLVCTMDLCLPASGCSFVPIAGCGSPDSGALDAGLDAGEPDAPTGVDAGGTDASGMDASAPDAATADGGALDGGSFDAPTDAPRPAVDASADAARDAASMDAATGSERVPLSCVCRAGATEREPPVLLLAAALGCALSRRRRRQRARRAL